MVKRLRKLKIISNIFGRCVLGKSALINVNIIATNLCNQHCPMCNTTLMRDQKNIFTLDLFKEYMQKLKPYNLSSCTISGGEATLVKELPEIIEEAVKHFPFGVLLITNLYGNTNQIMTTIESALKNNVNLSISFDGIGETADILRGAKNVFETQDKHFQMIQMMKNKINSSSTITLHTVISNLNLQQLPEIYEYSKKFGWKHTIAPVNILYYQNEQFVSRLDFSQELLNMCEYTMSEKHVQMLESYIKGIALYACNRAPKLCPYLKSYLKTYKFFLEPDGNVSLCDRQSIGNINEQSIDDMTRSSQYRNSVKDFENCRGCWMGCFVEPSLRLNPFNGKLINRLYEMIKNEIDKSDSKLFSLNNFETKLSEKTCVNLDKLTSESIKISNKLH